MAADSAAGEGPVSGMVDTPFEASLTAPRINVNSADRSPFGSIDPNVT